jgi:hypothetical protein
MKHFRSYFFRTSPQDPDWAAFRSGHIVEIQLFVKFALGNQAAAEYRPGTFQANLERGSEGRLKRPVLHFNHSALTSGEPSSRSHLRKHCPWPRLEIGIKDQDQGEQLTI